MGDTGGRQVYLTAGVERWREYRDQLVPLGKKPVLFVMMNSTKDADEVADYLRTKYPTEFAGNKPHSPVNGIVSVLMLREGWDVQLEKAPDVARFSKLPRAFGFSITYTDAVANLRYYEPDFVAVTNDGVHHLIETTYDIRDATAGLPILRLNHPNIPPRRLRREIEARF